MKIINLKTIFLFLTLVFSIGCGIVIGFFTKPTTSKSDKYKVIEKKLLEVKKLLKKREAEIEDMLPPKENSKMAARLREKARKKADQYQKEKTLLTKTARENRNLKRQIQGYDQMILGLIKKIQEERRKYSKIYKYFKGKIDKSKAERDKLKKTT